MTIATLSSAVLAPINGAAVRRLFAGSGRVGSLLGIPARRGRVRAQAQAIQAAGLFGAVSTLPDTAAARKWPFPPVQPAVPVDPPQAPRAVQMPVPQVPVCAPVASSDAKRPSSDAALGDVRNLSTVQALGVRRMVIDVLLVAMWGALIPGLMWLGAAAGF
ncbi:hypothetical protein [Bordetella genomosp. 13]|uniref:hypothetical protein n=1 Tax=Bordetella genomosp. 13 TaxID=463040 RepID=UPI0011A2FC19|nr:hypothetical protein [Bordetella genomosp. 13]